MSETVLDNIDSFLNSLSEVEEINNDPISKKITIKAKSAKENKDVVVLFEKLSFSGIPVGDIKNCSLITQNDIYYTVLGSTEGYEGSKVTIIYPATQKHIEKYSKAEVEMFEETPEVYEKVVLPYINSIPKNDTTWIKKIVTGTAQNETYYYVGDQFIIAADFKWDKRDLNTLYLQAIVADDKIKSLRDLNNSHVPLLELIREETSKVLQTNFGLPLNKVKLAVHYQPTFYQFHVHIVSVNYGSFPGLNVGQAHLLDDIISLLKLKGDIFQHLTLTYHLSKLHKLYDHLKKHNNSQKSIESKINVANVKRKAEDDYNLEIKSSKVNS